MRSEHPPTTSPSQAITTARHIAVRRMSQALDFYLALGFEVISVADGWALLRMGAAEVVLAEDAALPQNPNGHPFDELA